MGSIEDLREKIKPRLNVLYYSLLAVVVGSILFGLGRLSVVEERHKPIRVLYPAAEQGSTTPLMEDGSVPSLETVAVPPAGTSQAGAAVLSAETAIQDQDGAVVGSKSGKKYYFPWCGTLKRVKPENRVPFSSIEAARAAGYTPAGNCKGLK